jgi:hypothetical protein
MVVRNSVCAVLAFVVVVLCLAGCKDTSTNNGSVIPAVAIGIWKGDTTVEKQGTEPDTFNVVLTIQSSGAYELFRTKIVHASSTGIPDTSTELGTCSVSGDTITLVPRTCSAYISTDGVIQSCPCNPAFPSHVLINTIANNSWTMSIIDWVNSDILTYVTQKQ